MGRWRVGSFPRTNLIEIGTVPSKTEDIRPDRVDRVFECRVRLRSGEEHERDVGQVVDQSAERRCRKGHVDGRVDRSHRLVSFEPSDEATNEYRM